MAYTGSPSIFVLITWCDTAHATARSKKKTGFDPVKTLEWRSWGWLVSRSLIAKSLREKYHEMGFQNQRQKTHQC